MLRTIARGGVYFRCADPEWEDPLDSGYAERSGGRWNAPGSFPVVYLNATVGVAVANVARKLRGQAFTLADLRTERRPVLVETDVPEDEFADIVTDAGCTAAGLPVSYPLDDAGREIGWSSCRPIGRRAWDEGFPGIAARSAAVRRPDSGEELAWFARDGRRLTPKIIKPFDDWFSA